MLSTQETVRSMAGCGVSNEDIARVVGLSLDELLLHHGKDIEHGRAIGGATVGQSLLQAARQGSVAAAVQLRREAKARTTAVAPRPRGRPSVYNQAVADEICRRMALGESLHSICRDDGFPPHSTVREWAVDDREGFSAQYARARELQAHAIAEAAMDEALSATDPMLARLAFDARKWFAGKVLPKHYGDKAYVDHTFHKDPDDLTDAELAAIARGSGRKVIEAEASEVESDGVVH